MYDVAWCIPSIAGKVISLGVVVFSTPRQLVIVDAGRANTHIHMYVSVGSACVDDDKLPRSVDLGFPTVSSPRF